MPYWTDKVALVTGASSGLGRALAERLADSGAKLVLVARGAEKLQEVAATLGELGVDVLAVPADVTRDDDVAALFAQALARFGRLDLVVNNVGRSARGEAIGVAPAEFREALEVNFLSAVRCAQAAAPHLLQSQGHLVNIGSLGGKSAAKYLGSYPATKAALGAYTQQLRLELGPRGLHVLLVCPGPIARDDAGQRYSDQTAGLPESARRPGGGVKTKAIPPEALAAAILRACEQRKPELVWPWKARLLFALQQLSPRLGDWILGKATG